MDKLIPYLNLKQTLSDTGDYTYSFICKCGAVLDLELSKKIHYNPKCLKCNSSRLQLRYSIILGDLWMNDEILRDQTYIMSMICKCDGSKIFPRCDRNGDGDCPKIKESGDQ